jgi:hypothetical protein
MYVWSDGKTAKPIEVRRSQIQRLLADGSHSFQNRPIRVIQHRFTTKRNITGQALFSIMAADDPSLPMVATPSSGSNSESGRSKKGGAIIQRSVPLPNTSDNEQNSSFSVDTDDEVLIEEEDQDDVSCPTCGIQLYKIQKKCWFKRKTTLAPLTLHGIVESGVCIACTNDTVSSRHMNSDDASEGRAESPLPGASVAGETIYIGDYNVYGQRHGPGEMIWGNGDRYVGNFFNGNRDGKGTLWFADGK